MPVLEVKDKADFDAKVKEAGDKLVVIDFYATWCGPCKMISPEIVKLSDSEEWGSKCMFLKVDVDENEEVTGQYKVSAMPTFVFLKNGSKVAEFSGANKDKLLETIKNNA
eukprot:TRINITY_DN1705_c0_g2_i1.p2 TRINITY_DN1705_c0_g2~~TRINITY_DN1705_c0_g2_i1.p2  ORF type:complete len:110 (+),score=22.49 TRINITY_DN1705_c0_g2_i1:24-353(+)